MRLVFLLATLLPLSLGLDIVFYLTLVGKSHLNFVASLIDILVERGHNVDLVFGRLNSQMKWENATRARNVFVYGFPGESPWMKVDHLSDPFKEYRRFNNRKFASDTTDLCRIGLGSSAVDFLKNGHYDAIISSDYDYCGYILARAAGIRTVVSYTATNMLYSQSVTLGLPNPVSCVTGNMDIGDGSFSMIDKIKRLYYKLDFLLNEKHHYVDKQTALAREFFGPQFPNVDHLARNTDIVFINSNELIEQPLAISHKVKYIGGATLLEPKPLSESFDDLLSKTPHGNVLFSFGTQIPSHTIPAHVRRSVVESFRQFPDFNFIWKYEQQPGDEDIFQNVTNIYIVDRLPQNDLLNDDRVVAFITHTGLNSLLEASFAGKPMLAIPLFSDQSHNARTGVVRGTTIELDKTDVNTENLSKALTTLLVDQRQSYRDNALRLKSLLEGKREEMRARFGNWVEFAAKHGNLHQIFNLPAAELDMLTYYCVDVVCVVLLCFLSIVFVSYKSLVFLIRNMGVFTTKEKLS